MSLIDANNVNWETCPVSGYAMKEWLAEQSTVEAEPVKHGWWIIFDDGGYKDAGMKCSCCNTPYENYATAFHYCPNCGAKMDE